MYGSNSASQYRLVTGGGPFVVVLGHLVASANRAAA
jgi:hypothetical protein